MGPYAMISIKGILV